MSVKREVTGMSNFWSTLQVGHVHPIGEWLLHILSDTEIECENDNQDVVIAYFENGHLVLSGHIDLPQYVLSAVNQILKAKGYRVFSFLTWEVE